MTEGVLLRWNVEEGALVKPGDVLGEVETSKCVTELEAIVAGRVTRILVRPGESIKAEQPLAVLSCEIALDEHSRGLLARYEVKEEGPER
jgi:pyruvate/2-oxoglutarate dehydrogenase complex dihydrolipoamide acyltransferase (E2) component